MKRHAFTLVEVLVVLVIIGLLAALILPTLSTARGRGWQASCISNLRQIGDALHMYQADADGDFPHEWNPVFPHDNPVGWGTVLLPYVGDMRVYHCPSTPPEFPNGNYYYVPGHLQVVYDTQIRVWPEPMTVLLYCYNHTPHQSAEEGKGQLIAWRENGSVEVVPAASVHQWTYSGGVWYPPESGKSGKPGGYMLVFPNEPWPIRVTFVAGP